MPVSGFRFEYQAAANIAIHNDHKGGLQTQMPYAIMLFHSGLGREPLPIDKAIAEVGIDREIADLKCRSETSETDIQRHQTVDRRSGGNSKKVMSQLDEGGLPLCSHLLVQITYC